MDINNRVKDVRKSLGVSMETFGARIGVTRSAISRIESGVVGVTNQNITAICREYNVNESWLRSGIGNMFLELNRAEMAANIVGNAIASGDDFVISTFVALGQLTPQQWAVVKDFVYKIKSSTL
jgi:transcriptional regulator with XRE-family HTH domain